jgi:hypothetical protein
MDELKPDLEDMLSAELLNFSFLSIVISATMLLEVNLSVLLLSESELKGLSLSDSMIGLKKYIVQKNLSMMIININRITDEQVLDLETNYNN